ncbi:hypothetical protein [Dermatobacter hominis]|uniref:hypothetical protein n=1 Tax=Dermatobacter hominis TaxID=2884263 RepID=UPI001D12DFA7|nr:hypothetical protein [Dermatobacter hominis]UDY35858.1 hypothetical protein LH044_21385 [Dermatobacter hominis]
MPDRLRGAPDGRLGVVVDGGAPSVVTSLVGVYDADGTLRGELAYVAGRIRGSAHCALCDITHGALRERPGWRRCRDGLPVPFETFHRNDQPDDLRPLTDGRLPLVVARTDAGPQVLLGAEELEACASSPDRLVTALDAAMTRLGLGWERSSSP